MEAARAAVQMARAAVATAESQQAEARGTIDRRGSGAGAGQGRSAGRRGPARSRSFAPDPDPSPWWREHAVSQETLDDATAAELVAEAEFTAVQRRVAAQEAALQQTQAAIMAANSNRQQAEAVVTAKLADQRPRRGPTGVGPIRAQTGRPEPFAGRRCGSRRRPCRGRCQAGRAQSLLYEDLRPCRGPRHGKNVEQGAYVQVGQPLLALVEPDIWVVANFKETQLNEMRPGQPVTVNVDAYPDVHFKAHVDSVQRGSGARFSLLPPENATGNYVKVVQRCR